MKLEQLLKNIENVKVEYPYDEAYCELYNYVNDYMNDTQDYNFEYVFEDYIDYDTAEEMAKSELEKYGLDRLYFFLGDTKVYGDAKLFKLDGYANLHNVEKEDIEMLKEQLIDDIKMVIADEKE